MFDPFVGVRGRMVSKKGSDLELITVSRLPRPTRLEYLKLHVYLEWY
jgi:hypothetical protein